jgi:hypothetical protein
MKFSIHLFFLFSVTLVIFILSYIIAPFHVEGDQVHYTNAYDQMKGLNFLEALSVYRILIYSFEPIHFVIVWVFANLGFDKIFVMAILNGLLSFLFFNFIYNKSKNYFLSVVIFFSNYYLYTMFFTLEKLKVAAIFILIALIYDKKLYGFFSIFSHLQMVILLLAYRISKILSSFKINEIKKTFSRKIIINGLGFVILSFLAFNFFELYITEKLNFYIENNEANRGFFSIIPVFFTYGATLLCADNKKIDITIFFAILASAVYIIGGDRINMFAYFGFLYFSSYQTNLLIRKVFLSVILFFFVFYYGYKSYSYLTMVVFYGG